MLNNLPELSFLGRAGGSIVLVVKCHSCLPQHNSSKTWVRKIVVYQRLNAGIVYVPSLAIFWTGCLRTGSRPKKAKVDFGVFVEG